MEVSPRAHSLATCVEHTLDGVGADEWNRLVGDDDPFFEHEFLHSLEQSGAVGEATTWQPRYLLARRGGRLVAAVPLYVKWDSYGEYIFDWQWADAYQRAGVRYFPKGVVMPPFTPASGPRILLGAGETLAEAGPELVGALLAVVRAEGLSGIHVLFLPRVECDYLAANGFLPRITHQFHWHNRGYRSFDDFMADLRASKRKHVRKERRAVADLCLTLETFAGENVRDEHVDAIWRFYGNTIARKGSQAYFERSTFMLLASKFRHRLVLVLARRGGEWVAGSFNVCKGKRLYGRYWGTSGWHPNLHFECCYYRPIEYAIANGLDAFEAGAQGEHKFLRGFVARPIFSAHWITDPAGRQAIGRFLDAEREHADDLIAHYNRLSPLKYARAEGA